MRKFKMFGYSISMVLLFANSAAGQGGLSIDECQQKARANYPDVKQYGLLELSARYDLSSLSKLYLPQVSFNAQASYQSDVVRVPIDIPGVDIPSQSREQYRATLDVSQTLWDGGSVASQRRLTALSNELDKEGVDVALYALRERVNNLFFGILMLGEQLKQLDILNDDLQNGHRMVEAFVRSGTAMQSDADAVRVEILNTMQRKAELLSARAAYLEMLSAMTGAKIDTSTVFVKPVDVMVDRVAALARPELALFDRQLALFDARQDAVAAKNMPRISLFLQGGYGKPGLNMLSDKFDFFALGGLRLTWNFGGLYTRKNELGAIAAGRNLTDVRRETFVFNVELQSSKLYGEIEKARRLIELDDEIISLRAEVKKASESKYRNGVYTVNDLLRDINAESLARQAKIVHEIRYLHDAYNFRATRGMD
ncbi:MAG: TolC family protein [Prevotellaceae bacterium]|jgi:outer membrane protein TolC|nr:TolC family protein [Prevotellaceae bacterium]